MTAIINNVEIKAGTKAPLIEKLQSPAKDPAGQVLTLNANAGETNVKNPPTVVNNASDFFMYILNVKSFFLFVNSQFKAEN